MKSAVVQSQISGISEVEVPQSFALQEASYDTWDRKYRLKTKSGEVVDQTLEDTYQRIAAALSDVEAPNLKKVWYEKFVWALHNGAIPAGRIVSNAGAQHHKPSTSTINCTVSGTISDSMQGILHSVYEAGLTLKAGCGIGYEFSTLRPKGAYVSGAGATTGGPLPFMDIFDTMCFTVSSAGGRRGAQMGVFNVSHPDILEFINAKRQDGRLRQFNLSCLITDDFVSAVKVDDMWELVFPATADEMNSQECEIIWKYWPTDASGDCIEDESGKVALRVYKKIRARKLWDSIMKLTYDYAEPGFILIDRVNELNNNWYCEDIRATNPCGEQPLPPYGSCLLGSINLTKFVEFPFTEKARFDWEKYESVIAIFTRMLDNVVEVNGLPLKTSKTRFFANGAMAWAFLGLGSTLTMLKIKYGSSESVEFTEKIARKMAITGWKTGIELAKEKGVAPICDEVFDVTQKMLEQRPEMKQDGVRAGHRIKGSVLMAKYSRYMQQLPVDLTQQIADSGVRFTHHSSIAPTGTISLSMGNNVSNGIEPSLRMNTPATSFEKAKSPKKKSM